MKNHTPTTMMAVFEASREAASIHITEDRVSFFLFVGEKAPLHFDHHFLVGPSGFTLYSVDLLSDTALFISLTLDANTKNVSDSQAVWH
jgi:hypothetical protein